MHKSLRHALAALAAVGTAGIGPVAAQSGPMVPPATPGPMPVMPTAPAQPMPMPGSDAPAGPMIPRTMPGMPPASAVPMPMPGTTDAAPSKPAVQISVTIVDAPPNLPPIEATPRGAQTGIRDDLRAARLLAASRHIVLTTVAGPTLSTLDGVPATLTTGTTVPYTPKPSDPNVKGQKAVTLNVGDTVSATPHLNPDGTVTVKLSFRQTHLSGPPWRQLGPPQTETRSFQATQTFHSGDTLLLDSRTRSAAGKRLYFATVTLVLAGKSGTP